MQLRHLPRSASVDAVATALEEDAVVVIDRLVDGEALDRIATELEPYVAVTPFGPDDFAGRRTKRTGALIARSPASRELIMNPLVLGAVDRMLSAKSMSFQLHLTQL